MCGAPQGSVLRPILFLINDLFLGSFKGNAANDTAVPYSDIHINMLQIKILNYLNLLN